MNQSPPLTDGIAYAIAQMVDDAGSTRREPSHSDIEFCITQSNLTTADPTKQGQTVGKAKRVRAVLGWAIENEMDEGRSLVGRLLALIRSQGGFRPESPNFVGAHAIKSVADAM